MNGLSPLSEDFISRLLEIIPEKRLDAKGKKSVIIIF